MRICYQPKGGGGWGRNVPRPGMALLTFREKRDVPLKEKGGKKEDVAGLLHLSQAQRERGGLLPTSVPQAYPLPHPH